MVTFTATEYRLTVGGLLHGVSRAGITKEYRERGSTSYLTTAALLKIVVLEGGHNAVLVHTP
jgi:hypothetical protein